MWEPRKVPRKKSGTTFRFGGPWKGRGGLEVAALTGCGSLGAEAVLPGEWATGPRSARGGGLRVAEKENCH